VPRSRAGKHRLLPFTLSLWLAACGRVPPGLTGQPTAPRAGDPTARVQVFLIAPGDQGRSGRKVGCGDSAVPVEITLPRREPALAGSLHALLALKGEYHEPSGLYNALYASTLELVRIDRQGAEARVYLKGYLELGGDCDNPRLLAELQETALQFSDVSHVQFFLEDKPLPQILAGKG
jgi:sporulation and spore germination protein